MLSEPAYVMEGISPLAQITVECLQVKYHQSGIIGQYSPLLLYGVLVYAPR